MYNASCWRNSQHREDSKLGAGLLLSKHEMTRTDSIEVTAGGAERATRHPRRRELCRHTMGICTPDDREGVIGRTEMEENDGSVP